MTTRKNTGTLQDVPAYADAFREFDAIQKALFDVSQHLLLVDQRLWNDFEDLPAEYHPAASVLHDAVPILDKLYTRYEGVNMRLCDVRYGPGWRERVQKAAQGESDAPKAGKRGNGAGRVRA